MTRVNKSILAFMLAALTMGGANALDAKVISVSGKVEVQQSGSSTWKALKAGDKLSKGSVVSTGFKSSAKIQIDDSTVSLEPLTRMTIEQLASNSTKDEAKLYLNSGKVSADVKKTSGKKVDFKVTSPVATASVRGTSFSFTSRGKLFTKTGLVSKGLGAPRANIVKSDTVDDFVPADGKSSATTSTKDISGNHEVPVFAGQTSSNDSFTGLATNPQSEKASSTKGLKGEGTSSLAVKESSGRSKSEQTPISNDSVERKGGIIVLDIGLD